MEADWFWSQPQVAIKELQVFGTSATPIKYSATSYSVKAQLSKNVSQCARTYLTHHNLT